MTTPTPMTTNLWVLSVTNDGAKLVEVEVDLVQIKGELSWRFPLSAQDKLDAIEVYIASRGSIPSTCGVAFLDGAFLGENKVMVIAAFKKWATKNAEVKRQEAAKAEALASTDFSRWA